jgi:hypothetical protein
MKNSREPIFQICSSISGISSGRYLFTPQNIFIEIPKLVIRFAVLADLVEMLLVAYGFHAKIRGFKLQ